MADSKHLKQEIKRRKKRLQHCQPYLHKFRYCVLILLLFLSIFIAPVPTIATEKAEFVLQIGHATPVTSVSFSPDGKWLASGSSDNTVKIWDSHSGKLLRTLSGHADLVLSVSFSPDGKWLASGSSDNTVKIWDSHSGKLLRTLSGHANSVWSVSFSPDGKWLASGSEDNTIKIWDSHSWKLLRTLSGHTESVLSVSFSPDGKWLASGSSDNTVKIWDSHSGKLLRTLSGHADLVLSVSFSPDGKWLASGSSDNTVKIWDSHSGKLLRTLSGHADLVWSVSFSPDGKWLASGSEDNTIKIWDSHSGKLFRTLSGHANHVLSVRFSPDGKWLASGSSDNTVKIWDSHSWKLLRTLSGHANSASSVSFSPDGKWLASGSSDNTVKIWDSHSGKLLRTLSGHANSVWSVSFSPDGKWLASGSEDNTVKIWDSHSGKLLRTLSGHAYVVLSVSFSPDGKWLASGSEDNTVKIWDSHSGKLLRTLSGHAYPVWSVSFSPDGKWLASGILDNTVKIWDSHSGKLLRTLSGHANTVLSVSFSPDGKWLASGSYDNTVKIWDSHSGKLLRTLSGHTESVLSVSFSPDGKWLASGSSDNTVKIWDSHSGKLLRTLSGHAYVVLSVSFSPDGRLLASASGDTSIRFWNNSDGSLISTSHSFNLNDYITFTTSGYYVASAAGEKYASWRIGTKVYSFDQYSEQFNRPDLVAKALFGETLPEPVVNLATDVPPKLIWVNQIKMTISKRINLVIRYEGSTSLQDLILIHNNNLKEDIKYPSGKKNVEFKIPLTLTEYENSVTMQAFDQKRLKSKGLRLDFQYRDGRKGLIPAVIEYDESPQKLGGYKKKYAIIIGISDYKNLPATSERPGELVDLKYTHKDAMAFRKFIRTADLSGGNWVIRYFENEEATGKNIDYALTGILSDALSQDLIYIFFSGHGRGHPQREKDVYLLTWDFEPDYYRSGYSYRDLLDLIADSNAKHIIAFVDACRSGTIGFGGKGEYKGNFDQDALGERVKQIPENRVVFSSGRGTQRSWEDSDLQYSVFTYYLLKGLRGEAEEIQNSQFVDLGELAAYVRKKVYEHTKNSDKMEPQDPRLYEAGGVTNDNFPVAIRIRK